MAEAMLARAPLAHRAADLARLRAAEIAFLAQIDVRCPADAATSLGFPLEPNTVAGDDVRGVLWLGPDEWLVVGLPGTAAATIAELAAALAGTHHSVVDVSANRAVLELAGADRLTLLASGCGLDLGPGGGWTPGRCAQTLFARGPVLLQERQDATRVFVRPSYADYVVDRLLAAAATIGDLR
ncbi:MAG: sarcosine oxidase subunit gamma [Planctomycetaceae bacterium]